VAVCQTGTGLAHDAGGIADRGVETLDLEAAGVAGCQRGRGEGAEGASADEAECVFQMGASGGGGEACVVGDGEFVAGGDGADGVDGLARGGAVPAVVGVWETAVVEQADGRVDGADVGGGTAGKSVGFGDAAEWVLAGEVVVEGEQLSLLGLWEGF